ncbi:MAG: sensor histidine kinase [Actinomycetes bacterium]
MAVLAAAALLTTAALQPPRLTDRSVALALALGVLWIAPLADPRPTPNATTVHLDELLIVPVALLPVPEALTAAVIGTLTARVLGRFATPDDRVRRMGPVLSAFNSGNEVLQVLTAVAVAHGLRGPVGPLPGAAAGALVGVLLTYTLTTRGRSIAAGVAWRPLLVAGLRDGAALHAGATLLGVLLVRDGVTRGTALGLLGVALGALVLAHLTYRARIRSALTEDLAAATVRLTAASDDRELEDALRSAATDLLGFRVVRLIAGDTTDAAARADAVADVPGTELRITVTGRPSTLGPVLQRDVAVLDGLAATAGAVLRALRSVEAAERSDRSRRALLETVAHDLRSPLATAILAVETLDREGLDAGTRARLDVALRRALRSLQGVLDDVLVLHQGIDVELDGCRPDEELAALVPSVGARLGTAVRLTLGAGHHEVSVPAEALRRLVENLVVNAHVHGAPPVEVTTRPDGEGVLVTVTDGGPGVPAAVRDRLGARDNRGDAAKGPGLGLGLRIVAALVEGYGGRLEVSEPDAPSRISVWLPGATAPVELDADPHPVPSAADRSRGVG